jgi:hypothetical protein
VKYFTNLLAMNSSLAKNCRRFCIYCSSGRKGVEGAVPKKELTVACYFQQSRRLVRFEWKWFPSPEM